MDLIQLCEELDQDIANVQVEQFFDMQLNLLISWVYLPNGDVIRFVDDDDSFDNVIKDLSA